MKEPLMNANKLWKRFAK